MGPTAQRPAPVVAAGAQTRLEVRGISKSYGGVAALKNGSITCRSGEVHLLLGENGAGKSTFIKALAGVVRPDQGHIAIDHRDVQFSSPNDARKAKISTVFQELSLIPTLSVWQNIWLGQERMHNGRLEKKTMRQTAQKFLDKLGSQASLHTLVEALPLAEQQLVEVAKSLICDPRLWILDEPTSSLYPEQVEHLFTLIAEKKGQGCSVIYITHRLAEAFRIADTVTIFRDGSVVGTYPAPEISAETAVKLMSGGDERAKVRYVPFGKTLANVERKPSLKAVPRLAVRDLQVGSQVRHINFDLYPGEILGIAGLQGHGQESILYALSGHLRSKGLLRLDGEPIRLPSPGAAIQKGIILLSGDRRDKSVLVSSTARLNMALSSLGRRQVMGWIKFRQETDEVQTVARQLFLKTESLLQDAGDLSGGTQQKLAIGRVLLTRPRVVILDDPTRGVDVGTKAEFYALLEELATEGLAIILSSSDTAELVELANRVLVLRSGQVAAVLAAPGDITVDRIVKEAFQK
ncbi:MAG: sugar ABC transporter ATP-binding protein [Thermaerobacter sp.]|nr:sugar ABC transporter ATP-binding protein [Thermaerobacter sp.]